MGLWVLILVHSLAVQSSDLKNFGPESLQDLEKGAALYIDPQGNIPGQIYSKPGLNWKNCLNDDKCKSVALASSDDKLTYTGNSKIEMLQMDEKKVAVVFVEV